MTDPEVKTATKELERRLKSGNGLRVTIVLEPTLDRGWLTFETAEKTPIMAGHFSYAKIKPWVGLILGKLAGLLEDTA